MLLNGPLFASIRAPDFLAGVPSGWSSKTGFCPGTRNSRCYRSLNQILKLLSAEWEDESAAHFSLEDAEYGKKNMKAARLNLLDLINKGYILQEQTLLENKCWVSLCLSRQCEGQMQLPAWGDKAANPSHTLSVW